MKTSTLTLSFILCLCCSLGFSQICDLVELDNVPAPGSLSSMILSGGVAYVAADTAGIVQIDVSDPSTLNVLGFDSADGPVTDIMLEYFSDVLITAEGAAGIGTYGIGSEGLTHYGTTEAGETIISIGGIGSRLYAGSAQGTLFTMTIGSDNVVEILGAIELGGEVTGVFEKSGRVYCSLGTANEIAIVDAGSLSAPTLLTTVPLSGAATSLARSDNDLLCGVEGEGLVTFSISGDSLVQADTLPVANAPHAIFSWNNRIYMAAPEYGVYEADASLGSGLLQIAELELSGATGLATAGDILFVGRGTNGFSAVDLSGCANAPSNPTTWFIPAGARTAGSANSFWVTDVAVTNFTNGIATFNVAYMVKDENNSNPLNSSMALGPGKQIMLEDIFGELFGLETANGGLRIITSDVDVKVTSRTYNAAGAEGTYGQFIPALTVNSSVDSGVTGTLQQLQENTAFRTNIGFLNLGSEETQVSLSLYDSSGTLLGTIDGGLSHLLPYSMAQIGQAFKRVGADNVESGYAVIKVLGQGGPVLAYASVVDNGSGDPIYVPSQNLVAGFNK